MLTDLSTNGVFVNGAREPTARADRPPRADRWRRVPAGDYSDHRWRETAATSRSSARAAARHARSARRRSREIHSGPGFAAPVRRPAGRAQRRPVRPHRRHAATASRRLLDDDLFHGATARVLAGTVAAGQCRRAGCTPSPRRSRARSAWRLISTRCWRHPPASRTCRADALRAADTAAGRPWRTRPLRCRLRRAARASARRCDRAAHPVPDGAGVRLDPDDRPARPRCTPPARCSAPWSRDCARC